MEVLRDSAKLLELLEAGDLAALATELSQLPPVEIEEFLTGMDRELRWPVLQLLDPELAAEVFGGLEDYVQEEMTETLSGEEIAGLVEEMDSDDAADAVRLLEPEEQDRVLDLLEDETEEEVRGLLEHEEDTAGDLMMAELAALHEDALVAEAIEHLREYQDEIKELYNVYLVDSQRRLVGSLSLRDMVLARPGMPLKAFMEQVPVTVTPNMDQEEVAQLFRKYDLVSLPVVDETGLLVGRITVDDVIDVIAEEATEDLSRFAGLGEISFQPKRLFHIGWDRLPWLILGLFGGLLSGRILQGFEHSLARALELAFFVPVIMALAGNIGIQSSTIIVRGLATGEIQLQDYRRLIFREIGVSVINGVIIGVLTFLVVWAWLGNLGLGIVVSASMISVVLWATLTGTAVPLLLRRMGFDPAYATGPFVTTTNDIVALSFYLFLAWRLQFLL